MLQRLGFIVLLLVCQLGFGQAEKYYSLSTDEGIISNHIDHCFVDSYGYLWMASYDGVQRWDGVNGYTYTHSKSNKNSLSSNICYTILEDSNRDIWVGTIAGLCKIERQSDKVSRIDLGVENLPVNSIVKKDEHNLWIGTSAGLLQINLLNLRVSRPVKALANVAVFDLVQDKNLWVGSFQNGLYQVMANQVVNFPTQKTLSSQKIRTLCVDSKKRVWMGTLDKGIKVLDKKGNLLFDLPTKGEVRAIYENHQGQILIGVLDKPLLRFNEVSKQLETQSLKSQNLADKFAEGIFSIAEDKFGNTWFASHGMGMFYTNVYKNKIGQNSGSGSQKIITAIVVDAWGNEWAGTDGGLIKSKNGISKTYTVQNGLSSNAIQHLSLDQQGFLWISTMGGGVMSLHIPSDKITVYQHQSGNTNSLIINHSKAILADDSLVWIGTHGDGLAVLHKKSNKIYHRLNNGNYPFDLGEAAWINHLFKDKKGRIWVSTCFGLYRISKNKFSKFLEDDGYSNLASNYVNMVAEDVTGKIWVIGESGGLQFFDEKQQQFVAYVHPEIPSCIKSLSFDKNGNLWMGSNVGLLCLNIDSKKLKKYTFNNGFQGNFYFHKAIFTAQNGKMYVGGLNGYNSFFPSELILPRKNLFLFFETADLKGDAMDTSMNLLSQKTMEIPYPYKFSNVSFSIPNLYSSADLKVEYLLKGLNKLWLPLKTGQRELAFTGLAAGKYTLQLRYSLDGGNWILFERTLQLKVLPPWWLSWWFKVLLTVLLIAGLMVFYQLRTQYIRERNLSLQKEVRKQTLELKESNVALLEQIDETTIQKEELEELNLEYKKQAHTIIQQQNTIVAQNRDFNRIIKHVSLNDNGEISALLSGLKEEQKTTLGSDLLLEITLFTCKNQETLKNILSNLGIISTCENSEQLLEILPDFMVIDSHFKGSIHPQVSHIPIIRIIDQNALLAQPEIVADITVSLENITAELPSQIQNYIVHRQLINERFASNAPINFEEITPHQADKEFIQSLIVLIETNLDNPDLDNEFLGDKLNLSRTVLYSKIKSLTGLGVHEFIKTIRVKKSVELLKEGKLNVSQIAYEVGFSSPSYYIRCFVKQFGVSPKEYKNKL